MHKPYLLLSCTRYDPILESFQWNNNPDGQPSRFLLLRYHLDRLSNAAQVHQWPLAKTGLSLKALFERCLDAVNERLNDTSPAIAFKVRSHL
jgi:4-amino-4-deoxychorismate lyase